MAFDFRYPIARWLYRPISTRAATVLARTSIRPQQITWVSAVFAFAGAGAFAMGAYVPGALLTFLGVVIDCVDGDLARLTGRTSRSGAFLDSVLDRWTDSALILGLAFSDVERLAAPAGLALTMSLLTSYTRARAQSLGTDCPEGIGGRDARILVLIVAALSGVVFEGLVLVTVLGLITSVHRAVAATRALDRAEREERALGSEAHREQARTKRSS